GALECPQADGLVLPRTCGVDEVDRSPFAQSADRRAVVPARDLADLGFGGLSGDAGEFDSARIAPHGVIVPGAQHDGTSGYGRVESTGVEESSGDEAAVLGGYVVPPLVRVGCGVAAALCVGLVDARTRAHLGACGLHPAEDRMGMAVSEGWHEVAAVEVDVLDRILIRRQRRKVTVHLGGTDRDRKSVV